MVSSLLSFYFDISELLKIILGIIMRLFNSFCYSIMVIYMVELIPSKIRYLNEYLQFRTMGLGLTGVIG